MKLYFLVVLAQALVIYASSDPRIAEWYCNSGTKFEQGQACAFGKNSFCCIGTSNGLAKPYEFSRGCEYGIGPVLEDVEPSCDGGTGVIKCC
ncbi:hypothetical protein PZA11_004528 [Diplocarpon coronariae]